MERQAILDELYKVVRLDPDIANLDPSLIAQKVSACRIALKETRAPKGQGQKNAELWLAHVTGADADQFAVAVKAIKPYKGFRSLPELGLVAGILEPGQKLRNGQSRQFSKLLQDHGYTKKKSRGVAVFAYPVDK